MPTQNPFVLCVRLTPEEYQAFTCLSQKMHETRSALLRKAIREMLNGSFPDLLTTEQALVRSAITQLARVGNNLNQIAHAANSGVMVHQRIDCAYLNTIFENVQNIKNTFRHYFIVTRKRYVMNVNTSGI